MESIKIQAWNPRRAKRRVALPIVVLVNVALVATALVSSAIIYQRLVRTPQIQIVATSPIIERPSSPAIAPLPVAKPSRPTRPAAIEIEQTPEPIDISKSQRREPRPVAPLLEAKPPEAIAATVIVDVSSGRQVVDLPGEGRLFRIARIEGFPGRPIISPSDGDLARDVDIQPLSDRAVYLELSTRGGKLSIETKSALPQFGGRLSVERAAKLRDEATKRFEVASVRKAAILGEIAAIEAFLRDGQPKKLSVYGQGETQKIILQTNLEVIEFAVEQAKSEMLQAKRVYAALTEHLPKMRIAIERKLDGQ